MLNWSNIRPFRIVYEYVRDLWDNDNSELSFLDFGTSLGIKMEIENSAMQSVTTIMLDEELLSFILLNRSYE